jgi:hypothetical protein
LMRARPICASCDAHEIGSRDSNAPRAIAQDISTEKEGKRRRRQDFAVCLVSIEKRYEHR